MSDTRLQTPGFGFGRKDGSGQWERVRELDTLLKAQ
jgi:hypothetical protein